MSDRTQTDSDQDRTGNPTGTARTGAEWTTLAISTGILIGVVGLIIWLAIRGTDQPPAIIVEPNFQDVRAEESGYYLPITIRNDGDATVQDAIVRGELDTGSGQPEDAEVTVDFLASGEEVYATFVFRSDPSSGELTAGVTSYKVP